MLIDNKEDAHLFNQEFLISLLNMLYSFFTGEAECP